MYVLSHLLYPGHSSNTTSALFQQPIPVKNAPGPAFTTTYNGNHSATVASADLPLLTGEDLKILDAFDPDRGVSQFNGGNSQMMYQQTTVNGHGSVMI